MKRNIIVLLIIFSGTRSNAQQQSEIEHKAILVVVQQFFDAMEKMDTSAFRRTALPEAYDYFVQERNDSIFMGARPHMRLNQSTAANKRVIKEQLRNTGVKVQVHKRIAVVWAPYNLWVDTKFSHCGVDVFTMLKAKDGWKIATIAFSIEPEECDKEIK